MATGGQRGTERVLCRKPQSHAVPGRAGQRRCLVLPRRVPRGVVGAFPVSHRLDSEQAEPVGQPQNQDGHGDGQPLPTSKMALDSNDPRR